MWIKKTIFLCVVNVPTCGVHFVSPTLSNSSPVVRDGEGVRRYGKRERFCVLRLCVCVAGGRGGGVGE